MTIKVGDKVPLFEAVDDEDRKFSLSETIGKKNIVLYFYPKDNTMGCTQEACAYRDNWDKINSMDSTVVGISSQDPETHRGFKKKNSLPFTLLSDPDNRIRKMFGATGWLVPPRITFVIDKSGIVRFVFNSQLEITKHVKGALKTLEELETKKVQ
jgi:thioredoxin-dependent peroxiredoxin